jgi:hypothetical protein
MMMGMGERQWGKSNNNERKKSNQRNDIGDGRDVGGRRDARRAKFI